MTLDPGSVLMFGFGYGASAVAMQGFAVIDTATPNGLRATHYSTDNEEELQAQLHRQNVFIMQVAVAAVTSGMLN